MLALAFSFLLGIPAVSANLSPRLPADKSERPSIMQRYQAQLQQAKARGQDTRTAETLASQSNAAMHSGDRHKAQQLMQKAIEALSAGAPAASSSQDHSPRPVTLPPPRSAEGSSPVFLLAFTHHYSGPGGYYPTSSEVREAGEFFIRARIPGTLFFDGILVERLQKEDPALIQQIRNWNLPLGYHGEETHGPYPVASELLGEIHTLKEAQGYQGPWSLTTGQNWDNAVKLVEERYSYARPYAIDPDTRRIQRLNPSATDRSRIGGLKLVQQALGRDVSMMTSHSLESAPEGYAFRRMSSFGFDQPAVPIALHALRIFRIGDVADQVMSIAGKDESIFWYMGRLHSKGDENGEAGGFRLGALRAKLQELDRTRPRLLLVGFNKFKDGMDTAQYLETEFFPANPGSCWVTGDTLADHFEPEKAYRPSVADQLALAHCVTSGWSQRPPDLLAINGRVFSLADAFECFARALFQRHGTNSPSTGTELHALYGPVTESGAPLLRQSASLEIGAIHVAAQFMMETMDRSTGDRFIPARIIVGSSCLNSAEFLYAMAATLLAGTNRTVVVPPSQLFPPYADLLQAVFKPKAAQPVCYTQGQLWTVKPVRLKSSASSPASTPMANSLHLATNGLPKSIRLVFASNLNSQGGCHRDDPSGADLYYAEYNLETGKASHLRRLTSRTGPEWFPALSPDGRSAVYDQTITPSPGIPAGHELWQIDLTQDRQKLLVGNARFPAFDVAGRFLYYSQQNRKDHKIVRSPIMQGTNNWLRLGTAESLATPGAGGESVEDPSPLPDNSAVAFHWKTGNQGASVALMPFTGGPVQSLSDGDGCGHVSVSPDGQSIACTRSRDGHLVMIRRSSTGWAPGQVLPLSTDTRDYQDDDERFRTVREVRHSYVEWVTSRLLLVTTHGANAPRNFQLARLYLVVLQDDQKPPRRINLSAAIELLAGQKQKDFCSASSTPIP